MLEEPPSSHGPRQEEGELLPRALSPGWQSGAGMGPSAGGSPSTAPPNPHPGSGTARGGSAPTATGNGKVR